MTEDVRYVSRGGHKMAAALDASGLNVNDLTCADLGCSVGGFTDCLLKRGAKRVYAVDTAYGQLAWTLRQDERVIVMERSNALHVQPQEPCDLVALDLGWTRQDKALPVAKKWLKESSDASIITLIKPHYESDHALKGKRHGKLSDEEAQTITERVLTQIPEQGLEVVQSLPSPIRGGKGGNLEYLAILKRA